MNESAKEWISKLMFAYEQLYLERYALESLLVGAKVPGWKPMYERLCAIRKRKNMFTLYFSQSPIYCNAKLTRRRSSNLLLKLPRSGQIH